VPETEASQVEVLPSGPQKQLAVKGAAGPTTTPVALPIGTSQAVPMRSQYSSTSPFATSAGIPEPAASSAVITRRPFFTV
jgi:hypothetical protein